MAIKQILVDYFMGGYLLILKFEMLYNFVVLECIVHGASITEVFVYLSWIKNTLSHFFTSANCVSGQCFSNEYYSFKSFNIDRSKNKR